MRKPLWRPSEDLVDAANVTHFMNFVNEKFGLKISSYRDLYDWSIDRIADFWAAMWEFGEIKASRKYDHVFDDLQKFPGARWFVGAKLNFAENLLKYRDLNRAFIFKSEVQDSSKMTYKELFDSVANLAASLMKMGVSSGDRVAAYMPNMIETAIAMLAVTSVGAIWSSCGTELGPKAIVDRFGQIEPKILFTVDGYPYKDKKFSVLANVEEIVNGIHSLEKTIMVPYMEDRPDISHIANCILFDDFISYETEPEIHFSQFSFDHPVYIMFSSGTTGRPKCMVQSAGGVLINHLKELILHADLKRKDRILYITSPSWMMWNWLISSLAVGSTLVLYDGNPNFPSWHALWRFIEDEEITIFGCSASYINYLRAVSANPEKIYNLSPLREILQTGSPLSAEGFEYVYREIKQDLHFNSIAGGTDINGCFAAGTPIEPVYAGELQSPALGMKVKAYDELGKPVIDKQGELVCELPAPSMPLYFWNDPDGKKYHDAYFGFYPHTWRHGDWVIIHGDTGGITFLGRSDFTLKPSGVRIGPAEIYGIVERFTEIADSLVVGQDWKGDQRIILFVKLAENLRMTKELKERINETLRKEASTRHVPTFIIQVPSIPYTFNMKKVESAVANLINGKPVSNRDAIVNSESLDYYEKLIPELQKE